MASRHTPISYLSCSAPYHVVLSCIANHSRDREYAERSDTLRTVDQHALYVRRCGRTSVKARIMSTAEFGSSISVMYIDYNVCGVDQHNQVLGEVG